MNKAPAVMTRLVQSVVWGVLAVAMVGCSDNDDEKVSASEPRPAPVTAVAPRYAPAPVYPPAYPPAPRYAPSGPADNSVSSYADPAASSAYDNPWSARSAAPSPQPQSRPGRQYRTDTQQQGSSPYRQSMSGRFRPLDEDKNAPAEAAPPAAYGGGYAAQPATPYGRGYYPYPGAGWPAQGYGYGGGYGGPGWPGGGGYGPGFPGAGGYGPGFPGIGFPFSGW